MDGLSASEAVAGGEFSGEQKAYLRGFFAAAAQMQPYVGQLASGQLTADPHTGGANLAADVEPTFFGTPVGDLCAEEVWKYESNPLDVWDQLLAHAAGDKARRTRNIATASSSTGCSMWRLRRTAL